MKHTHSNISVILYEISKVFGGAAKEFLLNENWGKRMFEIGLMLKYLEVDRRVLDVGRGLGVNLLCLRKILSDDPELCLIGNFKGYTENNRMGSGDVGLSLMQESTISVVNQDFWANPVLPYKTNYFDLIICSDVIEHLPRHPLKLLGEIKRLLRNNGTFILGGPNSIALNRRVKLLFGKHPYMPFDSWRTDEYISHYREYSREEYRSLIEMTGGFGDIKTIMSIEPSASRAINRYYKVKHRRFSIITMALYMAYIVEKILPYLRQGVYITKNNFKYYNRCPKLISWLEKTISSGRSMLRSESPTYYTPFHRSLGFSNCS